MTLIPFCFILLTYSKDKVFDVYSEYFTKAFLLEGREREIKKVS